MADRIVIRYLRDHAHWKAGQEVSTPVEDGQPLIDAGIAELSRTFVGMTDEHLGEALSEALRAEVLGILREAGTPISGPLATDSGRKAYGEKEIVDELNRRSGTRVSVKHGMKWLRQRGARFEPSDRPGSRTSLRVSEFERLGLPPKDPT